MSSRGALGPCVRGIADVVSTKFVDKFSTAGLPEQVVVVGQSVRSFFESLPSENELRSALSSVLPTAGSQPKGWSGNTVSSINGKRTKMQVIMSPIEASRHNNPFRADSVTKSLISQLPDMISEARKSEDRRVSIICAVPSAEAAVSVSFGIARALPRFSRKTDRGKDPETDKACVSIQVSFYTETGDSVTPSQLESISVIVDSIRMSQALTDTPPNELNVSTYVELVKDVVSDISGVSMEVIRGKELEERGFGGIWNVGKGNTTNPPALVILSYKGKSTAADQKSVVLVGKGIVYDTGGLAIKSRDGMCGMKTDMSGSAAMFSSFVALARMGGLPSGEPLHCVLCLAENSVGPDSFRNDDILRLYSGLTVEINNTDAEGRLVLADGCSYAAKHLNPRLVVDMATLTGAQGIATGVNHAAILSANESDETEIVAAGKRSGDLAFPILFCPEFHRPNYKSEVADMKNSVSNRADATSSASGWFVYDHMNACGYEGNWVHVDMASPATFHGTGRGTGYGVGLMCAFLGRI